MNSFKSLQFKTINTVICHSKKYCQKCLERSYDFLAHQVTWQTFHIVVFVRKNWLIQNWCSLLKFITGFFLFKKKYVAFMYSLWKYWKHPLHFHHVLWKKNSLLKFTNFSKKLCTKRMWGSLEISPTIFTQVLMHVLKIFLK